MEKRDLIRLCGFRAGNGLAASFACRGRAFGAVLGGQDTVGGGMRSATLTLPGFTHEVCSPLTAGACSPFLSTLPYAGHGLPIHASPGGRRNPFDSTDTAALWPGRWRNGRADGRRRTPTGKCGVGRWPDGRGWPPTYSGRSVSEDPWPGPLRGQGAASAGCWTAFRNQRSPGLWAGHGGALHPAAVNGPPRHGDWCCGNRARAGLGPCPRGGSQFHCGCPECTSGRGRAGSKPACT
jgi:hypothetical protein